MTAAARISAIIATTVIMTVAALHIADTASELAHNHNARTAAVLAEIDK